MIACPNCSHTQNHKIYNNTLIACEHCEHIWADLSLDEEQLRVIYAENYFKGEEYADYLSDKLILQTNFQKRLNSLKKLPLIPFSATFTAELMCKVLKHLALIFVCYLMQLELPRLGVG